MKQGRQAVIAAAFSACLVAGAAAAQTHDPGIQRSFVEGVRLLQAGDYEAAARIFEQLVRQTNSPRVKLELARTLFHLQRYAESRALFKEVQFEPDVPWQVRDNIDRFMHDIDNVLGYVRFAVSLVSDSNPRNITSQRDFTIGGVRVSFEPPEDNKRVTGLNYGIQAYQPLAREQRVSGYFTGSYLDYPSSSLDRLTVDAGLAKEVGSAGARFRAGMEAGTFGDRALYNFPYLAYLHPLSRSATHVVHGEVKGGRVNFPHYNHLDASYGSATLSTFQAFSPTLALSLAGTAEDSRAREEPYSYYGLTLAPGMSWLIPGPALLIKAEFVYSERRYRGADPLFGDERVDRRTRLDISVRSKQWRWRNLTPALIMWSDRTRSNISFYSYEKLNFAVALE